MIYIYSRNLNKLKNYNNFFEVKIIRQINKQNLVDIDNIFICTRNDVYENLIKENIKTELSKNVTLYLDTPLLYHFYNIKKFKINFKNIFISEDEKFDPIIVVIKDLIKKNNFEDLFQINLNKYGYILHSISQISSILEVDKNLIEKSFKYGIFLNFKKLKYLFKINDVKICFNHNRDWQSEDSNIEIFFKKKIDNKKIKKFLVKYIFTQNKFSGFLVNEKYYELNFLNEIKNKINFYNYNSKYT